MNNHHDAFKLIGERLRKEWRDVETAPLPERISRLVEQLEQREAARRGLRRRNASGSLASQMAAG